MEEKKEYLNEEQFQKNKKKIIKTSLIVLIIGVLIGSVLIAVGVVKSKNHKRILPEINLEVDEETKEEQKANREEQIADIQKKIDNLREEIAPLEQELTVLEGESNTIFLEEGFSENYNAKQVEIQTKEKELEPLQNNLMLYEAKLMSLQMSDTVTDSANDFLSTDPVAKTGTTFFNNVSNEAENIRRKIKVAPYYIAGSFIIITSIIVAAGIYFFAIQREIAAFKTQQVMPVAQEGMEKMAPSIGKVSEEIAKGVAKGKKEGEEA